MNKTSKFKPQRPALCRLQKTPRVLQTKLPAGRQALNPLARSKPPSAPPVYRPQPIPKVLQTKRTPGQVSGLVQLRQPLVAAPRHPRRNQVLQLAQKPSQHYTGYWPPSEYPPDVPPTPSGDYYDEAANYFASRGNLDAFDSYIDQYGSYSNTTVGQTFGTQENEDYDASYVDIPGYARPSAPNAKALWNQVYAGLHTVLNSKYLQIACAELNDGPVKVVPGTKVEKGTNKKPPMCHIIAFNHIKWAADWIKQNSNHPLLTGYGKYKGPDPTQYPADTWKNLVWHISNLRPGHSQCNSKTAHQAVGQPSLHVQNAAILYVAGRLKVLEPTWF